MSFSDFIDYKNTILNSKLSRPVHVRLNPVRVGGGGSIRVNLLVPSLCAGVTDGQNIKRDNIPIRSKSARKSQFFDTHQQPLQKITLPVRPSVRTPIMTVPVHHTWRREIWIQDTTLWSILIIPFYQIALLFSSLVFCFFFFRNFVEITCNYNWE